MPFPDLKSRRATPADNTHQTHSAQTAPDTEAIWGEAAFSADAASRPYMTHKRHSAAQCSAVIERGGVVFAMERNGLAAPFDPEGDPLVSPRRDDDAERPPDEPDDRVEGTERDHSIARDGALEDHLARDRHDQK